MNEDLSKRTTDKVASAGITAAHAVFEAGGSPRAQIDAARQATGQRLTYKAHCGAKERARNLARMQG